MTHASEQHDSTVQEKTPGYIARRVTDTTETGLETRIVNGLIRTGWQTGDAQNYDRGYCVDLVHLSKFLKATQPKVAEELQLDSDPKEPLFRFGRCVVHFAVDDSEVMMCTELRGKASWFLPFNQGYNDGAGNPPNPNGLKTAYLWETILTPRGLTNILENYAQIVVITDRRLLDQQIQATIKQFAQVGATVKPYPILKTRSTTLFKSVSTLGRC